MLNLDHPLRLDAETIAAANLCDQFNKADLDRIGQECASGLKRDEASRLVWMKRNEAGMDLALQVQKDKNFPWPGCSNVAFPLVTIAAMQFHARAYPAIISGTDVVKCEVVGPDPTGQKSARADRISTHMSWQVLKQDRPWEPQTDVSLLNLSIVGCNFMKSYYGQARHNVSELVLAKDLVINYWAKSVNDCQRKTHLIPMFRNEIRERILKGLFRDVLEEAWYRSGSPPTSFSQKQMEQDNRQGVMPPQSDETTSFQIAEQHVNIDLDNDGYAEPYIITFEITSMTVLRIVCRFDSEADIERVAAGPRSGEIIKITAIEYFTKKTFIPSPDGGQYDVGFGVFLGPLNEATNSILNQLIDCGTMQTTAGGFLGRGAKIRGGVYQFTPFSWNRVDSTGDDLRKSIYPLPANEPSQVLFQLLGLLIDYTNRISGSTDMMVGESPGQNTPAETARTMVEMGQKIYTAIFKRVWRSMQEEFRKLYMLNARFLDDDQENPGGATKADYIGNPDEICPAADPNVTSDAMKLNQAREMKASAMQTPGYNKDAVEVRYLKALQVPGIQEVFPGSAGQTPPEDPEVTAVKLKQQGAMQLKQMELQQRGQEFALTLMEEQRMNNAKIMELAAKAENEAANAETEKAYAQVAIINAHISAMKTRNEQLDMQISHLLNAAKLASEHHIGMKQVKAAA